MKKKLAAKRNTNYYRTWWGKAVLAALTAGMFACTIATLMVGLHALNFEPIKMLEQVGIDRGMKLYSEASSIPKTHRFAFVDVDKEACKLFLDEKNDGDPECRTSKPVPTSLIIDFVRAAVTANAALIIIDVAVPEKNEVIDREALKRAFETNSDSADTWVIAPVYGRPSDSGNGITIEGDTRFDITSTHVTGRLLLASSAAAYAKQGIVRSYPIATCYATIDGQRWIPTIPYLAALLLSNPEAAQSYYHENSKLGFVTVNAKDHCSQLKLPLDSFQDSDNAVSSVFNPLDTARIPPVIRFFYSLPSLGMMMDEFERDQMAMKHIYNYQYYKASKLLDTSSACMHQHVDGISHSPGCFRSLDDYYAGKIVILGSSRAQAMDHVKTPIGVMSGSELIINATRAFLEFESLSQPAPFVMLGEKLKGIGIALIPMFFAWCLIFLSGLATRAIRLKLITQNRKDQSGIFRHYRWRILNWIRALLVIIIFISGLYTAYLLEVVYFHDQLMQGVATDLLLPALALGLQGFVVGAKIISNTYQQIALAVFNFVLNK